MNTFDILSPDQKIHCNTVLEASAGTGKTFTIEHLTVRFLLEDDPHLGRPLLLEEVLIVTFTKKAARELKERVRLALVKALKGGEDAPAYLKAIFEKDEEAAKNRLSKALAVFEENKIFTIHAFAARILLENAFETGFTQGENSTLTKKELYTLAEDFFQTEFSPPEFSKGQLACLLRYSSQDPQNLIKELVSHATTYHEIEPKRNFIELYEAIKSFGNSFLDMESLLSAYKKPKKPIDEAVEGLTKLFSGSCFTEEDFDLIVQQGSALLDALSEDNKRKNAKVTLPEALQKLLLIVEEACSPEVLLVNAAFKLKRLIQGFQEEEGRYSFDAILVKAKVSSENPRFATLVGNRYKALIIDEFQDTDPLQWGMFETLFLQKGVHIFLVGDPKQSIYRFRQADIYTYLRAADVLDQSERTSLSVNYRSNEQLIEGINLFFKDTALPLPKIQSALTYLPVNAGRKEKGEKAFHIVMSRSEEKKYDSVYIPYIAQEILRLDVDYGQIAVLVKDRFQSKEVQEALREAGIPAAPQQGTSLIGSFAHTSLIDLIDGFIRWKKESALQLAVYGPIMGLNENDNFLSDVAILRNTFFTEGFGLFFEELLATGIGERLLMEVDGEEFYQDLRAIASRIMDAEAEKGLTPDGILSMLKEALTFEPEDYPEWNKTKEAGKDAVKIVTIHSSKGLEYDFVFALGLMSESPTPRRIVHHDDQIKALLSTEEPLFEKCCEEIDAEKIRQLYVGITRARERLYLFMPPLNKPKVKMGCASPLDLWLAGKTNNYTEMYERIREGTEGRLLQFLKSQSTITYEFFEDNSPLLQKRALPISIESLVAPKPIAINQEKVVISSFSSLTKDMRTPSHGEAPCDFENPIKTAHTLPAGKEIGLLLHTIFEKISFNKEEAFPLVEKIVKDTPFSLWLDSIKEMVHHALETDIDGFKLKDVSKDNLFREQEFLITEDPIKGVIDLVFSHQGKYYLLDWKSNWLGSDYSIIKMQESMEAHQYTLQAKIYTKALKNYIALFDDRDFEEIFGGAYYIYLRGLNPENKEGVFHIPPEHLLEVE